MNVQWMCRQFYFQQTHELRFSMSPHLHKNPRMLLWTHSRLKSELKILQALVFYRLWYFGKNSETFASFSHSESMTPAGYHMGWLWHDYFIQILFFQPVKCSVIIYTNKITTFSIAGVLIQRVWVRVPLGVNFLLNTLISVYFPGFEENQKENN